MHYLNYVKGNCKMGGALTTRLPVKQNWPAKKMSKQVFFIAFGYYPQRSFIFLKNAFLAQTCPREIIIKG